jgi:hypothetical protein
MGQVLEKIFQCKSCGKDIRLQRNGDDSGWIKFEVDGVTLHSDEKKLFKPSQTLQAVQSLTKLVEELNTKVNTLTTEVAELRKETTVSKRQ